MEICDSYDSQIREYNTDGCNSRQKDGELETAGARDVLSRNVFLSRVRARARV